MYLGRKTLNYVEIVRAVVIIGKMGYNVVYICDNITILGILVQRAKQSSLKKGLGFVYQLT